MRTIINDSDSSECPWTEVWRRLVTVSRERDNQSWELEKMIVNNNDLSVQLGELNVTVSDFGKRDKRRLDKMDELQLSVANLEQQQLSTISRSGH